MRSKPKNTAEGNTDNPSESGFQKGLTSYGDKSFSLFLRKAFIKGAGYTNSALDRPVIGIINTGSAYNMPRKYAAITGSSKTGCHVSWRFAHGISHHLYP